MIFYEKINWVQNCFANVSKISLNKTCGYVTLSDPDSMKFQQ